MTSNLEPKLVDTTFKPEFLNRLDSIVEFNSIKPDVMEDIANLQLKVAEKVLAEQEISLTLDDKVIKYFAQKGYDPVFGARPLKRLIESELMDEVALRILEGKLKPKDTVVPKIKEGKLVITEKLLN